MLGGSVATGLSIKLQGLELAVGSHVLLVVAVSQVKHGVIQGMEACQGHKLELVAHLAQLLLISGNLTLGQVLPPVEAGGAVVCQELARELGVDAISKLLGLSNAGGGGLHPDEVAVWGIGQTAGDAGLQINSQCSRSSTCRRAVQKSEQHSSYHRVDDTCKPVHYVLIVTC